MAKPRIYYVLSVNLEDNQTALDHVYAWTYDKALDKFRSLEYRRGYKPLMVTYSEIDNHRRRLLPPYEV